MDFDRQISVRDFFQAADKIVDGAAILPGQQRTQQDCHGTCSNDKDQRHIFNLRCLTDDICLRDQGTDHGITGTDLGIEKKIFCACLFHIGGAVLFLRGKCLIYIGFTDKGIFCCRIGARGEVFDAIAGDKAYETALAAIQGGSRGIQDTRFEINDQDRRSIGEISGEADTVFGGIRAKLCIDLGLVAEKVIFCLVRG